MDPRIRQHGRRIRGGLDPALLIRFQGQGEEDGGDGYDVRGHEQRQIGEVAVVYDGPG